MGNKDIKLGKYQHFKGNEYEVVGLAKHSETLEDLVVYRALYGNNDLWVRPLSMFMEEIEVAGKKLLDLNILDKKIVYENTKICSPFSTTHFIWRKNYHLEII